jgi:predicted nuclease of predicted toxin-antitoxin system
MRIKLDENMPAGLAVLLSELGHEVDTVPSENLSGRDDVSIWEATQRSQRFLVTQDLDFSDIRRFAPGTHKGIMVVRLRAPGRIALTQRVFSAFMSGQVESWEGCFVMVTDLKIRIRRPA